MAVNQIERAFRAWPVLTARAANHKTITYGELGDKLGVHHRTVRYVLGEIQDYCMNEKLPPLTILVVNQGGSPGSGFIAYDVDHFEEGKELVYSYNWSALPNPFSYASNGTSFKSVVATLASDPGMAGEIMQLVKVRGVAQILFREALLQAYGGACCITGISFGRALEAAHIVPWAQCDPNERLDIRNGLLLNAFHHRMFDQGLVTVTPDYRVCYYDPEMEDGSYSPYDRMLTVDLHGARMRLPDPVSCAPKPEYLERSHARHEWREYLP